MTRRCNGGCLHPPAGRCKHRPLQKRRLPRRGRTCPALNLPIRNFKPKDFAQFHPGGELGKRLLTTAADVMRTEDMPIIPQEMHLGEAIIHVSKGKLGMGVALHEDGSIAGLITDGDIRRAMEKWQAQFFDKTVSDIMTRSPKIVSTQTKISEIQHIMNKYKIHSVLVADNDRHLLGIVDHYRCMV